MTENEPVTGAEAPQEPGATASGTGASAQPDPWTDVVRSLDEFGRAVTEWGAAVRDDPDNRRRMKDLQGQLQSIGNQVGEMADAAVRSDVAKQMGSAFVATGEVMVSTAKRVTDEVSPFLANAFRTAAESIHEAAVRIEKKPGSASQPAAATPPGPSPEPAPYSGEEPPAPATSGAPDDYVP